jgi:hypothetical protein
MGADGPQAGRGAKREGNSGEVAAPWKGADKLGLSVNVFPVCRLRSEIVFGDA